MFWELAFTSDLNFESTFKILCTESFKIFQVSSISRQASFKAQQEIQIKRFLVVCNVLTY